MQIYLCMWQDIDVLAIEFKGAVGKVNSGSLCSHSGT